MTDAVGSNIVFSGQRKYAVQLTNKSDGTGEAAVIKIDKSGLLTSEAAEPSKLVIEEIVWTMSGFTAVELFWDHTTDDEIAKLAGSGYINYVDVGGLADPGTTGGTGDVLLTTIGAAADATYDITIVCRLKQ